MVIKDFYKIHCKVANLNHPPQHKEPVSLVFKLFWLNSKVHHPADIIINITSWQINDAEVIKPHL